MRPRRPESSARWIEGERVAIEVVHEALSRLPRSKPSEPTDADTIKEQLKLAHRPLGSMKDVELVALQNVGREAFRELLGRVVADPVHRKDLIGFIASKTNRKMTEESVLHKAYQDLLERASTALSDGVEKAVRQWPTFADPGKVVAYLKGVCGKKILREFAEKRPAALPPVEGSGFVVLGGKEPPTPSAIIRQEEIDEPKRIEEERIQLAIETLLRSFSTEKRSVYVLTYRHSWKPSQIADLIFGVDPEVKPDSIRRKAARRIEEVEKLFVEAMEEVARQIALERLRIAEEKQRKKERNDDPSPEKSADGDPVDGG